MSVFSKQTLNRATNWFFAGVLALSSMTAFAPLFLSKIASAAGEAVVTPVNMQGWEAYTQVGGTTQFVTTSGAPLGAGALELKTANNNNSVASLYKTADIALADVTSLAFSTKQVAVPAAAVGSANPSYYLGIDADGTGATQFYILYETYYNGTNVPSTWQTWTIDNTTGKFWSSTPVGALGANPGGSYAKNFTLSDLKTAYPNAKVFEYGLNMGAHNPDWTILVDNFNFNTTAYDFELATIAPCTTTLSRHMASLAGWDLSETRATGHNKITADGLHIWTEGNASTDKAAGYYPVDFSLQNLGTNTNNILTVTTNSGSVQPGGQLVVDFNNDGTPDGILVGEPTVSSYGNNWWLNNTASQFAKDGAPHTGGGYGSNWFGTAEQWLNAFPTARVKAIGYSLGSGVKGDYTITKITAGCVNYTFGIVAPTLTVTTPAEGATASTKIHGDKLRIKGTFKDDIKANYATMQLVRNGVSVAIGTLYGYGSVYNPAATYADADGNYVYDLAVPANLPDGEYSLFYVGTDFDGGITPRLERKFFIDNTAPNAPNNLRLQVRSTGNFVGQNGWTNRSDVTALWNGNNSETVAYEYQYWNDVTTSSWKFDNRWTTNSATEQYPGTINQGQGKHYYCVVAIDLAGNRSNCSSTFSFNYDATDPVTNIVVSPIVDGKFTVSGDASDNLSLNRVYVQLVNRETGARYGGSTVHLIGKGQTAEWSVEYKISDLPQGNYAAHVEAVDMAGNRGTAGWTDNFFVDRTAPDVEILNMSAVNPVSFDIKATDTGGLKRIDYSLWTNSNTTRLGVWGAWISGTEFNETGITQYTSNVDWLKKAFADLSDGEYTLRATARDLALNSQNATSFNFVVDRTAPAVTVSAVSDGSNTTPTITGTVDADAVSVRISFDGGATWQDAIVSGTTWSYTVTTPLAVGPHTVLAVARDAVGNKSSSDTSTPQPYWTQFNVTAQTGGTITPANGETQTTPAGEVLGEQDEATDDQQAAEDAADESNVAKDDEEGEALGAEDEATWSAYNLVAAVASLIIGVVALLGLGKGRKSFRIVVAVLAAASVVTFLVVEDLSLAMGWHLNTWTAVLAVAVIAQVALAVAANKEVE